MNYYQAGLYKLHKNQLVDALVQFNRHKPIDDVAKLLNKYSLTQPYNQQEYIQRWLLQRITNPQLRIDSLNILGCTLKNQGNTDALEYFQEALAIANQHKLPRGATLINITYMHSYLQQHEKALQFAIMSIGETMNKQKVVALHNTAVEFAAQGHHDEARKYHQSAYDLSLVEAGADDPLTHRMFTYITRKRVSSGHDTAKTKVFRLRSTSRHNESSIDTFYYRPPKNISKNVLPPKFKEDLDFESEDEQQLSIKQSKFIEQMQCIDTMRQVRIEFLSKMLSETLQSYSQPSVDDQYSILNETKLDKQDMTSMSFAQDDTFENTCELNNKALRAAQQIQKWYRRNKPPQQQLYTPQQRESSAIIIQKQIRKHQCRLVLQMMRISLEKQKSQIRILHKLNIVEEESLIGQAYCGVSIRIDEQINFNVNIFTKKYQRQKQSLQLALKETDIIKSLQVFDEFHQVIRMPDPINRIAYQLSNQKSINYNQLVQLLYSNGQLQLYGVTDCLFDSSDNINCSIIDKQSTQFINIHLIQAKIRGVQCRTLTKLRQLHKQKNQSKFITKLQDNRYYYIIQQSPYQITCQDIATKRMCLNSLIIPNQITQFYGNITRSNCADILEVRENVLKFSDDLDFLLKKQKQIRYSTQSIHTIQRFLRCCQFRFIINLRILSKQRRSQNYQTRIFTSRKSQLLKHNSLTYQTLITAELLQINQQQLLSVNGFIKSADVRKPEIVPFQWRLFFPVPNLEMLQVSKILLENIQLVYKNQKVSMISQSIEEIRAQLSERHILGHKQSQLELEPTLQGRMYLNSSVFQQQYLKNDINQWDMIPFERHVPIGESRYLMCHIINRYRHLRQINEEIIMNQKHITDVTKYVNDFQGISMQIPTIIDPDIVLHEQMIKSATQIQRAFRSFRMRMLFNQRILLRIEMIRNRNKQIIKKQHYYDLIQKQSPFTTYEILEQNKYIPILLGEQVIQDIKYEWLIVLPYCDIVITGYSIVRQYYRIKYSEYSNQYINWILKSGSDRIIKLFSKVIKHYHPSDKQAIITEVSQSFMIQLSQLVKIKLLRNRIKHTPKFNKVLIKQFINDYYIRISYIYYISTQKVMIVLKKDNSKKRYQLDYFQLEPLYYKYHQNTQQQLDHDQFDRILGLDYSQNYMMYRKLLSPVINVLHSYSYSNSQLELQFDKLELILEYLPQYQHITYRSTTECNMDVIPIIVNAQRQWRKVLAKQMYQMKKLQYNAWQRKLLCKDGKLVRRTYLQRSQLENTQVDELFIVLMYASLGQQIRIKIELIPFHRRNLKEFRMIGNFSIDRTLTLSNMSIYDQILRTLQIRDNQLCLREEFNKELQFTDESDRSVDGSTPKLLYHQRRDYDNGTSFHYDAIHSGEHPVHMDNHQNQVRINVNLNEFRLMYPNLDYTKQDILPQISEQLVSSMKIRNNRLCSKNSIKQSVMKIRGNIHQSEQQHEQQHKGIVITNLLKYTQRFRKQRYMITITLEDMPIVEIAQPALDSVTQAHQTFINVKSVQLNGGATLHWQLTCQQVEILTNEQNPQEQANHLKSHLMVINNRMLYLAEHQQLQFDDIIVLPYKVLKTLQRMAKNRKFRQMRLQYEQQILELRQNNNQFIIYYNVCEFHSDQQFIVLLMKKKSIQLHAWNLRDYKRYSLSLYRCDNIHQLINSIYFENDQLMQM